mmetsp:Transcript_19904/g.48736  ORF Transcript_19904/g.48736 Transcript_19904/m.48736 type:complete len:89 (+) Transcript_19904:7-273(+)
MKQKNAFIPARDRFTVKGIEHLQQIALMDLAESSRALANFNEMSKEHIVQVKKVSVQYCKRIRKLRENLYKTFERIRNLKEKVKQLEK